MKIRSVLIANRGEIAVRIIRACREVGVRAIAVHSEADAGALWTRLADEAVDIGPSPARESYLDIDRLIAAARGSGADAVHPGYGLLSESPEFAEAVGKAGLRFIGPSPRVIATMGDKVEARKAAVAAGLPVLPGSDGTVEGFDDAIIHARRIGWPIAVKASFGGGGRGMRVAHGEEDLKAALEQATREASAAFGRGEIYLERYLVRPRHIEVQVLGDGHGALIHLGDRDCSLQRRHQKLIEEAPAPALSDGLRSRILDAAVTLSKNVGYEGAGTVEFLADVAKDAFYFLEMNTRLQVEHGVTELVTGIDLVNAQIRVAGGEALGIAQTDVVTNGCAIQARISAEDPWEDFRPTPGRIDDLRLPGGPWLRLDFGVESGDGIPSFYDSMFGKVQAWGRTRDEARVRLARALDDLVVAGPCTTAPYLRDLLEQPDFAAAVHDTGSVEREWLPRPADRPAPVAATASSPGAAPAASISERIVSAPWGGQLVDVAVYGVRTSRDAVTSSGSQVERRSAAGGAGGPAILAPMDSAVAHTPVEVGERVEKGAPVLVLEAMKMEVVLAAPHDGVLEALNVRVGDAVKSGAIVAVVRAYTTPGE
ncbi:MAG: acetyl-CoA carboxylase biotin carboxylase subunit [Brevundimonas sp.]|uniref:acetyl/propionyl/methylcrotonyl-CoA carboxylase subunit alpha n=1 Tax=Brevundimonas sp. TaxID=1871086 RepID=UPI00248A53F8|nr:acetyl-CoA carboxylase biotin carboxylase subunit [Brevundimonas sp.]MDI1327589.1 acetyl-CoA carboxylase biotin carboxylase subunit [Brevundimonas sp.]